MKYSTSPSFAQKLAVLADGPSVKARVARFIATVEHASDGGHLLAQLQPHVHSLDGEVYVSHLDSLRIFFTFGEDYLLLLDLALAQSPPVATAMAFNPGRVGSGAVPFNTAINPKFNSAINPKFNSAINPKFNSAINPKFNSAINPKFNSAINPKFNGAINPKFNGAINPKFNGAINPKFNGAINPKFNGAINPRQNPAFSGPFIYDLDANAQGYLVRANDAVDVWFNQAGDFAGTTASASDQIKLMFDPSQEWVAYLVAVGQGGYAQFSVEGEWIGFVA